MRMIRTALAFTVATLALSSAAQAQSTNFTDLDLISPPGGVSINLRRTGVLNQGFVGLGRLPLTPRDFANPLLQLNRADRGWRVWGQSSLSSFDALPASLRNKTSDASGLTVGVDKGVGRGGRLGVSASRVGFDKYDGGVAFDSKGWVRSIYGSYVAQNGLYAQAAFSYARNIDLDQVYRRRAYGVTGSGRGDADARTAALQIGMTTQQGKVRGGPFLAGEQLAVDIDADHGHAASLGNAATSGQSFGRTRWSFGLEAWSKWQGTIPYVRVAYVRSDTIGDRTAAVKLASVNHVLVSANLPITANEADHLLAAASLEGALSGFAWRASVESRFADVTDTRAVMALSKRF